ncbi:MAG: hypothetical protein ABS78_01105 [Phenylobacterium sp. SCN 70-31]|nr:MAG: hypothetical protein ABS78_01105 [Phenylobacterium sp. SCN 70-31]
MAVAAAGCLGAGAAAAQTAVEEVIVTATKREENLQAVPVSVTAFTAQELQRRGAVSLRDLQYSVPNFNYSSNDFNRRPDVSLRGITSTARSPGEDGSIGFYVDGVFLARPTDWNPDIQGLERVEVLRGPQGTLFGKNTIAGAVNMVTQRPQDSFKAALDLEAGNYNAFRAVGIVDMPLIADKLYSRVSLTRFRRDGFTRNVFNNTRVDSEDRWGGRLQLRITPFENFEANLSYDYMTETPTRVMREIISGTNPLTFIPGPRTVSFDRANVNDRTLQGVHLTTDATFGEHTITTITAYRKSFVDFQVDEDTGPLDDQRTRILDHNHQFSNEVRLTSPSGGRLDYVAGFFYLYVYADQSGGFVQNGVASPFFPGLTGANRTVATNSYAAYVNANYHINDQWTLNVGLRYGYETKRLEFFRFNQNGGFFGGAFPAFGPITDKILDHDVSPMVGIQYEPTSDFMAYAKWSRGNKSGGWNAGLSFRGADPYKAEQVDNYEAGFKADFLDGRARTNVAVFYMDYRDLAVTTFGGLTNGVGFNVDSAAKAVIKGAELDFTLVPIDGLEIAGGVGYLDSKYKNYQTSATANNNGNRLQFAPKWNGNLRVQYSRPIGGDLEFTARGEWQYRGSMYGNPANTLASLTPSYSLLNARVGIAREDERWGVYLWGRNLADKDYLNYADTLGTDRIGTYGAPRTYGIAVSLRY